MAEDTVKSETINRKRETMRFPPLVRCLADQKVFTQNVREIDYERFYSDSDTEKHR